MFEIFAIVLAVQHLQVTSLKTVKFIERMTPALNIHLIKPLK